MKSIVAVVEPRSGRTDDPVVTCGIALEDNILWSYGLRDDRPVLPGLRFDSVGL